MAGSLAHLVGKDGKFTMNLIDNMGDAQEALQECYILIYLLSKGNSEIISKHCKKMNFSDPWENYYDDDMKKNMTIEEGL